MLGPLEVRSDEGALADVPGARLRGLLVAFALRPGQLIPKTSLVDWIWGEQPPADATNALQRLVSRLRRALPDVVIDGQPEGYVLRVEPDAVDAVRFERLVIAGQAAVRAEDGSRQVRLLREALDLWRGAAMQDVGLLDSGALDAAVVRLEELRLAATEEWADAEVTLGRGADVVTELTGLVAAHPMRERLVGALMRALAAAGRDNEALLVYQRTKETLVSELGVDPSPGLSAVHVALLRGELGRREEARKTNLHAELTSFVGKDADIAAVRELIATRRLTTLIGPGGSGKTRLATETARTLLTDAERTVLRRLSVFSGGASLEAAERVCPGGAVEQEQVLDLLTFLAEKSLLRADVGSAPRYRMNGTIREYAGQRLAEAGESDLARHAHLAYFTELAETAEPHLRRAEQLEWLAVLEAEHDNIGSAMRGALAAGEAQAAMRLAAAAGWYWWLGGHKAEGIELLTAAANTPGEVTDDIRALVYALIVHFESGGRGDEHQLVEWIHQAYRYSQRSQRRHPSLEIVGALERMLQARDAFLTAFEPLLDADDPWVRALARLHVGKSRIVLGQGGQDADAHLEAALAEFRALGDRFGIWFALIELADRIAVRGELAAACERYDQAVAVLIETGAVEDVIQIRSRQAQLYWLLDDKDSSAAAMAEAQRYADRVNWPDALSELALARAELARWDGNAEEVRRQLGLVAAVLGDEAEQAHVRAVTHDLLGYLAGDLVQARAHHAAACEAAVETGYPPLIARVLVGVADLALRRGQDEQAARLIAASDGVRGLPDRSHPDEVRVEGTARSRLGDARFAEAALEGTGMDWTQLTEVTLAS
jgi:DNA-binding SARP family transcriptional activator